MYKRRSIPSACAFITQLDASPSSSRSHRVYRARFLVPIVLSFSSEREREREDDDDISLSSHGETAVASVFTSPRDKGAVKKGERIAEIVSVYSWATRGKKQESFRDTQSVK